MSLKREKKFRMLEFRFLLSLQNPGFEIRFYNSDLKRVVSGYVHNFILGSLGFRCTIFHFVATSQVRTSKVLL